MLPEIKNIIGKRKKLGLTQTKLAELAGVSQSFIAKVENSVIDPSYSKVKFIIDSLEDMEREKEIKAKDIMNRKVYFIKKSDIVSNAIKLMKRKGISQMPVVSGKNVAGSISEKSLLDKLSGGMSIKELSNEKIEDAMDEPFPRISGNTTIKLVSELLKENGAVLIIEKEEVIGIITKSDLLKIVSG